MGFEIIRKEQRASSMTGWFSGICGKVTDFLAGSVTKSKFESVAVEMEAQDYAFYTALKKAIPTAVYNAFDFTLKPPTEASNYVIFGANVAPTTNIIIPAGTVVTSQTTAAVHVNSYATAEAAILLAGQTTVQAFVECTVAGAAGNTDVNTINSIQSVVEGIDTVTNTTALSNGQNIETEAGRRSRFKTFISTLSRGTNAAVEYGAMIASIKDTSGNIIESVMYARCIDAPADQPGGAGTCYIANSGGTASSDLIAQAQKIVDGVRNTDGTKVAGWKAAGAKIPVVEATLSLHNCTVAGVMDGTVGDQTALEAQMTAVTSAYLSSGGLGDGYIYNEHVQRIMAIPGIGDVTITPAGNITPPSSTIIRPGALTVTAS